MSDWAPYAADAEVAAGVVPGAESRGRGDSPDAPTLLVADLWYRHLTRRARHAAAWTTAQALNRRNLKKQKNGAKKKHKC